MDFKNKKCDTTVPNDNNFIIVKYGQPKLFKTSSLGSRETKLVRPRCFTHRNVIIAL